MVLAILCSDEPSSQLELAGLCGLLPAQIVPVVDELQRRGLVERQRDESDRRRSIVRPTRQGTELLARTDELAKSIEDAFFGALDPATREQFAASMRSALARVRTERA